MSSGLELKDASAPRSLDGLEREERVEAMVEWFLDNFEDPGEHTPHESAEGGYQYIWGGPYDALDQISSTFPEAEQDEIEEAVEEVQSDGIYDWAPSDGRVQPDDYDELDEGLELDGGPASASLSDRLEALGGQLDRIEGHVAALLKLRDDDETGAAGIGHNRPPEDVDGVIDLAAVQESIEEVRTELAKPDRENDADAEKLALAETRFRRFLSPSIQITASTLLAAASHGAERQDKTKGEWAIAIRPDRVARYIQHLASAHAGDIEPLLAEADTPFADPLPAEIAELAKTAEGFDLDRPGEAELRAKVEEGVDQVLAALGEEPGDSPPQMGHNQPPGPVEEPPSLGHEIRDAAEQIRDELWSDATDPREIGRRGALLAWAGKVLDAAKKEGAKVLEKGKDMARDYMAKALWGATGTVGMTFKEEIVEALRKLAGSVLSWLQHISIF